MTPLGIQLEKAPSISLHLAVLLGESPLLASQGQHAQKSQLMAFPWNGTKSPTITRSRTLPFIVLISFLTEAKKPTDTEIYNKMTPFFTIVFGNKLHSEHYGTEIIISKVIREKQPAVDRILDQMSDIGTVHRNIG